MEKVLFALAASLESDLLTLAGKRAQAVQRANLPVPPDNIRVRDLRIPPRHFQAGVSENLLQGEQVAPAPKIGNSEAVAERMGGTSYPLDARRLAVFVEGITDPALAQGL